VSAGDLQLPHVSLDGWPTGSVDRRGPFHVVIVTDPRCAYDLAVEVRWRPLLRTLVSHLGPRVPITAAILAAVRLPRQMSTERRGRGGEMGPHTTVMASLMSPLLFSGET
jgi:hypothetical protein